MYSIEEFHLVAARGRPFRLQGVTSYFDDDLLAPPDACREDPASSKMIHLSLEVIPVTPEERLSFNSYFVDKLISSLYQAGFCSE